MSDLERFVSAQNDGGTFEQATAELRRGRKTSHWMWFVFPQLAGLGRSAMAQRFAIGSLAEAREFLAHPVLGARYRDAVRTVLDHGDRKAEQIFGGIDAMKFRSSLTLFARADPSEMLLAQAIQAFYDGVPDAATERLLASIDST